MNTPDKEPPPELPSGAAERIQAARYRAEEQTSAALDAFWKGPSFDRVAPNDLLPMLQGYAQLVFNAHAEEYLNLFGDAVKYEGFLRWILPGVVVKEILPTTLGSKRPGSSDVIGLRESLGEYKARIGKVNCSSEFSESEAWERVTGIPFADVSAGFTEEEAEEIWESRTGEAAGYCAGFWRTEGAWEKLVEDVCVKTTRLKSYFPYSDALVWALRDSRNCSDVEEILRVSLEGNWRGFVARWLEQPGAVRRNQTTVVPPTTAPSTTGGGATPGAVRLGPDPDHVVRQAVVQLRSSAPNNSPDTPVIASRRQLLEEYKAATEDPSNKRIYGASNSGIHKPQFYQWQKGNLSAHSTTTKNFERFLRAKRPPVARKSRQ